MRMRRGFRPSLQTGGFTLLELIIVVAIIGILMGLLLPVLAYARRKARESAARNALHAVVMALEKYRDDFKHYPPDDKVGRPPVSVGGSPEVGSEIMGFYLCTRHPWGEMHYGPYLENIAEGRLRDTNNNDIKELVSPLNNAFYRYGYLKDAEDQKKRRFLLVDPGMDGLWGGDIDPSLGWVSDGSDGNGDGEADDKDNIISTTQ